MTNKENTINLEAIKNYFAKYNEKKSKPETVKNLCPMNNFSHTSHHTNKDLLILDQKHQESSKPACPFAKLHHSPLTSSCPNKNHHLTSAKPACTLPEFTNSTEQKPNIIHNNNNSLDKKFVKYRAKCYKYSGNIDLENLFSTNNLLKNTAKEKFDFLIKNNLLFKDKAKNKRPTSIECPLCQKKIYSL